MNWPKRKGLGLGKLRARIACALEEKHHTAKEASVDRLLLKLQHSFHLVTSDFFFRVVAKIMIHLRRTTLPGQLTVQRIMATRV